MNSRVLFEQDDRDLFISEGAKIRFLPSAGVSTRLSELGRTEDARFSPDQTRLAIAGYARDTILVIETEPHICEGSRHHMLRVQGAARCAGMKSAGPTGPGLPTGSKARVDSRT